MRIADLRREVGLAQGEMAEKSGHFGGASVKH